MAAVAVRNTGAHRFDSPLTALTAIPNSDPELARLLEACASLTDDQRRWILAIAGEHSPGYQSDACR